MGVMTDDQVRELTDIGTIEPRRFKVVMLNDDYTTMDFVVEVLVKIFGKNQSEAVAIMENIHYYGQGVCGVYPYDIAETKAAQAKEMARMREFPLRCVVEEL